MKRSFGKIALLIIVCPFIALAQTNVNIDPNGYNILYHPNGRIASEGMMREGRPDGYWKSFYPTGIMLSEGNRVNFLLDSTWVFYANTGDTSEIINYRLGKKSGYNYVFETITARNNVSVHYLKSKELYLDDRREGIAYYYYPSGKLRQTINFRNGRRQDNMSKEFDENGMVITLYEYHNDYMISREFINRLNSQGERHGVWKTFHPNGELMQEDFYRNGILHGTSTMRSERGTVINQIVYREGNIVEEGIQLRVEAMELISYWEDGFTIMRKGIYLDSIPIGAHYFYNREGKPEKRINYNTNGVRIGEGAVDENENRIGQWNNYFETGELRSSGMYVNDRQHGEWHFYSQNGHKEQTGNINNGIFEGEWRWFFPSGNVFREEMYIRGRRHGLCVQYSDSASVVVKGEYIENERDGFWIEHVGDIREEGNYSTGLKEGVWKSFHKDGQIYHTGNFLQGNPDGRHLFYYPDGTIKEEQYYVMGRRYRNWKKYYENGALFLTITYNDDREVRINGIRVD